MLLLCILAYCVVSYFLVGALFCGIGTIPESKRNRLKFLFFISPAVCPIVVLLCCYGFVISVLDTIDGK